MGTTGPRGITAAAARLVAPVDVAEGRLSRLLASLYGSGALFLVVSMVLGLFDDGWRPGLLGLVVLALIATAGLCSTADRVLPTRWYVVLTIFGGFIMSLAIYWGGTPGAAAFGVIYIYMTWFAFIALRPWAVLLVVTGAAMHLTALLASGHEDALGVWVVTWGPALVTGLLAGAAVEWLKQGVEQLRDADQHRTRFVATVSHELRTPLAAILGSTETLQRHWEQLNDEQRWEIVEVIHRQAGRQLRLVNDVLAVTTSMAEAARPSPSHVRLAEVLQAAAGEMRFAVIVEVPPGLRAMVDADHLRQVVENLLVNADRYGAPPIELRASAEGGEAVIEVVDHGGGLPGGLDSGLLEPFVQGDSGDTRSSTGVGLGLTICRDLVAANTGTLDYVDTDGGGATFIVRLPLG